MIEVFDGISIHIKALHPFTHSISFQYFVINNDNNII